MNVDSWDFSIEITPIHPRLDIEGLTRSQTTVGSWDIWISAVGRLCVARGSVESHMVDHHVSQGQSRDFHH